MQFIDHFDIEYGQAEQIAPQVRRLVANNPKAYTWRGTNTYIVGQGTVAIIDPGPALDSHVEALQQALQGETVTHLLVTHTHLDHSPAASLLRDRFGAQTVGFGPLVLPRDSQTDEEVDYDFRPDITLKNGDSISGPFGRIEAVHTPGHFPNHLCFALPDQNLLFSGDHVMGWSTTVVSPPVGHMGDYMASLKRLRAREENLYLPSHGPVIENANGYLDQLIAHRHEREQQILQCLDQDVRQVPDIVNRLYTEIRDDLVQPAQQSVLAHLIDLWSRKRVRCEGAPSLRAAFWPAEQDTAAQAS